MQQIMPEMMDASSHTSSLMLVICMDSAQVQMLTLTPYKHFWLLEGGGGAKTTPFFELAGTRWPKGLAYDNGGPPSNSAAHSQSYSWPFPWHINICCSPPDVPILFPPQRLNYSHPIFQQVHFHRTRGPHNEEGPIFL